MGHPAGRILGIGVDLVDVARFARVAARHDPGFVDGLFTPAEIAWCGRQRRRDEHLAARFAAREAVLKALGTGLVGLMSWRDIEVVTGEAPGLVAMEIRGAVRQVADAQGVARVHLALATTRQVAAAAVVLEGAAHGEPCRGLDRGRS
jgi:holo-[acyl-carrier protein] synthase